jgi:threonine dehydrogenase-like Zn-dependent dehydrogenase
VSGARGARCNSPRTRLTFASGINPGKVFDLTLPLNQVAEGYRAMDERRAIKTLLRP